MRPRNVLVISLQLLILLEILLPWQILSNFLSMYIEGFRKAIRHPITCSLAKEARREG